MTSTARPLVLRAVNSFWPIRLTTDFIGHRSVPETISSTVFSVEFFTIYRCTANMLDAIGIMVRMPSRFNIFKFNGINRSEAKIF